MQSVVGELYDNPYIISQLLSLVNNIILSCPQVQCTCTDSDTTHIKTIANLVEQSLPNTNDSDPLNFTIADGGFMCGRNLEQMTFRAKLVAKGHRNSSDILSYLEEWLHSKDIININGAILRLNRMCNLSISSFGADLCDSDLTITTQPHCDSEMSQPSVPFNLGAIMGGVGTALVLIVTVPIIVVVFLHSKCVKRTGR